MNLVEPSGFMVQAIVNIISRCKECGGKDSYYCLTAQKCVIYFQKSLVLGPIVFGNAYRIMIRNIVNWLTVERVIMIHYVHLTQILY